MLEYPHVCLFSNGYEIELVIHFKITAAGIPDFRTPGSGLYDNLQKYNLPTPTAMFAIDFFKENPDPFFELARELWPGKFKVIL